MKTSPWGGLCINIFVAGDACMHWGPNECDGDVIGGEICQEGMNACSKGMEGGIKYD